MPDIKVKNYHGEDVILENATKVYHHTPESTIENPIKVPFTYGEAVSKSVDLDFSNGDMEVPIAKGELVTELTIPVPEGLVPENIPEGMYVAGVGPGTFKGSGGAVGPYITFDGDLSLDFSCTMYGFTKSPSGCFGQMIHLSTADLRECPDIKEISSSMFDGCTNLLAVYMTDEITTIDQRAFFACVFLPSIELPSKLTEIESLAFYGCMSLESLTIPSGVTFIGSEAFCECYALTAVTFEDTTGWYVRTNDIGSLTQIPSSDLADPATAATLLTSTYVDYRWYKE